MNATFSVRLCLVPVYINSFMAHAPVQYEPLQNLVDVVEKEDYLISSDDKSDFCQSATASKNVAFCSVPIPRLIVHMVCQPI